VALRPIDIDKPDKTLTPIPRELAPQAPDPQSRIDFGTMEHADGLSPTKGNCQSD
jgi:hypothetical protein